MENTKNTPNLTDDGKTAVVAIALGTEGFCFDGKYSNADVRAIVKAFKAIGFTPSPVWVNMLRNGWK